MTDAETPNELKSGTRLHLLEKLIAIFVSLSAALVVVFWYFGRRYSGGFFSAMNIPTPLTTLSTWEYAEVGGPILAISLIPLALSVVLMAGLNWVIEKVAHVQQKYRTKRHARAIDISVLVGTLVLAGLSFLVPNIIIGILLWYPLLIWISVLVLSKQSTTSSQNNSASDADQQDEPDAARRSLAFVAMSVFVLLVVGIFLGTLIFVEYLAVNAGRDRGRRVANTEAMRARLVVAEPLPITASYTTTVISDTTFFTYEDLYFLAYNNSRYFFYQCINADGKPEPVHMINEDHVTTLELLPATSQKPTCASSPAIPLLPSPSP